MKIMEKSVAGMKKLNLSWVNEFLLYLAGFALFYIRLAKHYVFMRDDVFFIDLTKRYTLSDYVLMRYETWSSRVGEEAAVWLYCQIIKYSEKLALGVLCLCFLLICYGLCYLIKPKTFLQKVMVFLLVYGVPNVYLSNSGWFVTILYYIMPLGLMLFALGTVRDAIDDKPVGMGKGGLYVLAACFAGNMEQYAFILGAVLALAMGWFFIYRRRFVKVIVVELLCVVFNIVMHLSCAGNWFRYQQEVANYWQNFDELSFFDKIYNGGMHCLDIFFFDSFVLCVLFLLISLFAVGGYFLCHKKSNLPVWCGMVVVFFVMMLWKKYQMVYPVGNNQLGYAYLVPVVLFAAGGYFLTVLYQFRKKFWFYAALMGIGLCSVVMIGFSPTLYASNVRVFLGMIFVLIFLVLQFAVSYAEKFRYLDWVMFLFALYWAFSGFMVNYVL